MNTRGLLVAGVAAVIATQVFAQQVPVEPAIQVRNFRSPEDKRKTGVRLEDIRPGERPDYARLREQPVVIPVRGRVYLIGGVGGNIAAQVGGQGGVMVDTGAPEAAARALAAYETLSPAPVRWLINTSADLDHTGGNEAIGQTGVGAPAGPTGGRGGLPSLGTPTPTGASIIQFGTVLLRMSAPGDGQAARPVGAWGTSTFLGPKKTMYHNGEPIEILHQPAAHSDGDVIVHFRFSDVIVAGDIFNTDRYPFFDRARGGSLQGVIDALNRIIDITVPELNQQGGTLVVPGHGRIGNETDVVDYRDMATIVRDRFKAMVERGLTLDQIKAARPTLEYDALYGATAGPWTTDMFYQALYQELTARPAAATSPAR
jgi:glyoxylase-like metal-dependent hydrolase (beta-lactamase superfamily II)